jgi:uncharacterized alpha-E superfamily protein
MLSRTANELFWMSRHIERAENTARMLDVTYRMSLLPYDVIEPGLAWAEPWAVPLITTGVATEYYRRYPVLSAENVLRFMILDAGNPSSVFCCLRAARESARTVRGAITSEMYEDLNSAWLEVRGYDYARIESGGVSEFLDWDNTARILDVKYHTLLPSAADVGGAVDYYQWGALLRSVSGFEAYRKIYSDVITPRRVAELLILREDMPRSLHACMNFIYETLQRLCDDHTYEIERAAGELHARLHFGRTDDVIAFGLHEYLMDFLERISSLGNEISRHFLVPA